MQFSDNAALLRPCCGRWRRVVAAVGGGGGGVYVEGVQKEGRGGADGG